MRAGAWPPSTRGAVHELSDEVKAVSGRTSTGIGVALECGNDADDDGKLVPPERA